MGADTPHLNALAADGGWAPIRAITPAVTCSAQATFLTGTLPRDHGIVGNGWYFRDLAQVMLWKQSNHLVHGEKVWETARRRDPACTCAKMFWWFNMYSTADWAVTPRPIYPADGRKIPDIYTQPADLRDRLTSELGPFPLFNFWGPTADITSSQWIAEASMRVDNWFSPTLAARLPAASRLQPAALRRHRSANPCGRASHRRGLRTADRTLSRQGTPRGRGFRVRPGRRRVVRCTSIACCARRVCWRCARSWASNPSTPARARPSPSRIIRSRTSTCATPRVSPT